MPVMTEMMLKEWLGTWPGGQQTGNKNLPEADTEVLQKRQVTAASTSSLVC
jgi:hypothetical protein